MRVEDIFQFAWRHCPGGYIGRGILTIFFISLYIYVINFMFLVAVLIAGVASLYLSGKFSWILANSFNRSLSGRDRFSGEVPGFRLYAGTLLIFLLYCELAVLSGMISVPLPGDGGASAGIGWVVFATACQAMAVPWIFLNLGRRRLAAEGSVGPDFRSYLETQAFDDLRSAILDSWQQITSFIGSTHNQIVDMFFRGRKRWLLWPLGVTGVLTLIAPSIFSAFILAAIFLLHGCTIVVLRIFGAVLVPAWAQLRNRSTGTRLP